MALHDDIRSFTKKYKKNIEIRTELNDKLFKICDHDKWLKTLKDRAVKCQKLYKDNDRLIADLISKLSGDLSDKAGETLFSSIFDVFFDRFEISDVPIIILLCKKAAEHFEKKNDYNKLVRIYAFLTYCNMEYYSRIRVEEKDKTLEYANITISYKEHYEKLDDPEARLRIFRTYANLMGDVLEDQTGLKAGDFTIYNEMMDLWNSDVVQKMDGDNEDIISEVEWMKDNMVYICACNLLDYKTTLSEEIRNSEISFIKKKLEEHAEEADKNTIYWMADMTLKIINSEITPMDAIHKVIMKTDAIAKPDFDKLSPEENCDILDEKYMMMELSVAVLRKMDFTEKERAEYGRQITFRFFKDIHKIPNNLFTNYVDDICKEYFSMVRPFLNGVGEKEQKLMQIFFLRQPLTYIHCLLVGSLAYRLGGAIIEKNPELLVGLGELDSIRDVVSKENGILDFIRRAGLIHDVGEIIMPTIINMQTRSLTEEEKEFILKHPGIGVEYLKDDKDFEPYRDVILGHHKSYDGKSGYPAEFDNTASPYRIIIDIISICDALENAEDYISRAYKEPKRFDEIIGEIYDGAGTTYNPYIADMIKNDDVLRNELKFIVTEGRIKATQEVYRNIVTCVRYGGSPYFRLNAVDMVNDG
ncbi:MAG: HD domain-containing protein [Lachnospiraceae bacterium]|nr:HD domain-containing protein [Lachnospiraceae bacterium]